MTTRIGLVGCAAAKLQRPAPARDLYTSPLFRKASSWAQANTDQWFVVSAKHHLAHPDTVLEPYDVRLGTNARASAEWAHTVLGQLREQIADVPDPLLVVLAGAQYRTILTLIDERGIDLPYEVPMAGLGIGQQLAWLTKQLEVARP